jgi:hypothetical protein
MTCHHDGEPLECLAYMEAAEKALRLQRNLSVERIGFGGAVWYSIMPTCAACACNDRIVADLAIFQITHLPCQLSPTCLVARSRDVAAETIFAALKPAHHDYPIVGDYTVPLEYSERRAGSVARDVHHHSKVKQTRAYMMDDCLHYMRQQGNHLGRVSDCRSQSWSQWLAARRRCEVAVVGEDVHPDSDQELNLQSLESVVEAAEDDNHTDSSWRWSLGLLVQNGRRCARTKARVQITPGAPRRSSAVASRIASSRHPWSVERGYK